MRARAAWAVLIGVIVPGAIVAEGRGEIEKAEARVALFSENVVVIDRADHEKLARKSGYRFCGSLYERRTLPVDRESFFAPLTEDSSDLGSVLIAHDKIARHVSEVGWQQCPKRDVIVGGNNSTEYHPACRCLTCISEANGSFGITLIPIEVGGFDVDICSQLALGGFVGEFDCGPCCLGRIFSGIGRFFGFQQCVVQSIVGFPEYASINDGGDKEQRRPSNQPSSESINWHRLVEPPVPMFSSLVLGLLNGLAGFVVLFGPHTHPTNYALKNVGAGLFFGGLFLSALAAFIAAAI